MANTTQLATLRERQTQFLADIFVNRETSISSNRQIQGLNIYRNNLVMSATRALAHSYPVVNALIGEEVMQVLAESVLKESPPSSGDWAEWGGELPNVLEKSMLFSNLPYLRDIAFIEWFLHQGQRKFLPPFDEASLQLLTNEKLDSVYIALSPGITVLKSEHPCQAIWQSHIWVQGKIEFSKSDFLTLQNSQGSSGFWLIEAQPTPKVRSLSDAEWHWYEAILAGRSLDYLLTEFKDMDFSVWLSQAISAKRIVGLRAST